MNKTNFILKFDFADATKFATLIYGAKFIEVNTYQPSPVQFILTSPLVDKTRFFSNNDHNRKYGIIATGLSRLNNEFPMVPIDPKMSVIEEVEVFMFYLIVKDAISE